MATKKFLELQEMSVDAIQSELSQMQSDLNRMKFDHGSKGLQNPLELNNVKKDISRLLTELRAREIKGMTPAELAGRSKMRLRRK
ncbi:MAG: 50S ribosomal protein L29 [Saprospiraceae bacterium]|jgi:large subunit ribosomal protein L29|nr:50S ribosomal protein L29 [Saprospiraceae bacterium]MBP6236897.1 50S ribosomal protein L29 [Saprospiraceae bacterium]MBP6566802.1 50S ribosomal protein L29 [Saprospiraceae bacterium]MBP9196024.1 50S ribosomal protein L29 [Saprospiraceae bacterium]